MRMLPAYVVYICLIYEYMFLYFVRKVKWKLGKEGDKQGEELLDKNKKTGA